MNIIFIEPYRNQLLPFTYTKPVSELRCGILKIKDKWKKRCPNFKFSNLTEDYLSSIWPSHIETDNLFVNASVFPNQKLIDSVLELKKNQALFLGDEILAYRSNQANQFDEKIQYDGDILVLKNVWDIFALNHQAIAEDYDLLTTNRTSESIPKTVLTLNPKNIYRKRSKTHQRDFKCI